MKKTEENGKQIGYIKGDCSITTVELRPDGSRVFNGVWRGDAADAEAIGVKAGEALKAKGGEGFFD